MNVKRISCIFAISATALLCSSLYAERNEIPLAALVARSPLIVVATLDNVKEYSKKGVDYGEGAITIHEVLFGTVEQKQKLVLRWSNPTGLACPRDEHAGARKRKLIWIFDSLDKLSVSAHPEGRLLPERKAEVIDLIKKKTKP